MSVTRIDLAESSEFDVGGMHVRPARRHVSMNGQNRILQPKVTKVLIVLASARSAVVSRHRLIDECWSGRIVSDDALNRCILALRHLAREFSPEPFAIETIPHVGYSLIERRMTAILRPSTRLALRLFAVLVLAVSLTAWFAFRG